MRFRTAFAADAAVRAAAYAFIPTIHSETRSFSIPSIPPTVNCNSATIKAKNGIFDEFL